MTFKQLQEEQDVWARENFGSPVPPFHRPLLGAMEELGELSISHQSEQEEEWRPVVGYNPYFTDHYEVSNIGRVRRTVGGKGTAPNRLLKPHIHHEGYVAYALSQGTKSSSKVIYTHLLVAAAFIGDRPEGYEVNHRNADKQDNRVENLEYVTHKENMEHAFRLGLPGHKRRIRQLGQAALNRAVAAAGRLCHAQLKQEQGIRGTEEEHIAAAKDAIADVIIYLADYASCRGFDLDQIMEEVWGQVKQWNWKKNPVTGQA